jgi:hypothetical protein
MVPGRRRARAAQAQSAAPCLSAGDQVVYAAEAIVRRAWAERLLRYCDHLDCAFAAACEQYEAACVRLAAAQRGGGPSEISVAHAALQRALDACRAGESAREQGRRALQTALDALAHTTGQQRVDAARAGRVESADESGDPVLAPSSADTPGPSTRRVPVDGDSPRDAWRTLWRFGRRRARRGPDLEQP